MFDRGFNFIRELSGVCLCADDVLEKQQGSWHFVCGASAPFLVFRDVF